MVLAWGYPSETVTYTAPQIEVIELKRDISPELYHLIEAHFGTSTPQAIEVAWCESNLRQYNANGAVLRGRENPNDIGVFQINYWIHRKEIEKQALDVTKVEDNVKFAAFLWQRNEWRDWKWSAKCHGLR